MKNNLIFCRSICFVMVVLSLFLLGTVKTHSSIMTLKEAEDLLYQQDSLFSYIPKERDFAFWTPEKVKGDFILEFKLRVKRGGLKLSLIPVEEDSDNICSFLINLYGRVNLEDKNNQQTSKNWWLYFDGTYPVELIRKGGLLTLKIGDDVYFESVEAESPDTCRINFEGIQTDLIIFDVKIKEPDTGKTLYDFTPHTSNRLISLASVDKYIALRDGFDYTELESIKNMKQAAEIIVENKTISEVEEFASRCPSQMSQSLIYLSLAEKSTDSVSVSYLTHLCSKIPYPQEKAAALCIAAEKLIDRKRFDEACTLLSLLPQSIKPTPYNSQISYWLTKGGDLYMKAGRKKEAAAFYAQGVVEGHHYLINQGYNRVFGYRAYLYQVIVSKYDVFTVPLMKLIKLDFDLAGQTLSKLEEPADLEASIQFIKTTGFLPLKDRVQLAEMLNITKNPISRYALSLETADYDTQLSIIMAEGLEDSYQKNNALDNIITNLLPHDIDKAKTLIAKMTDSREKDENHAKIAVIYGNNSFEKGKAYADKNIKSLRVRSFVLNHLIMKIADKNPAKAESLVKTIPDIDIRKLTQREIAKMRK